MIAKKDFEEVYSGDTFNQLSLTTRSLRSLKLLEHQECQTLAEIPREGLKIKLKANKSLLLLLVIAFLQLVISVIRLLTGYLNFDFISFITTFIFFGLVIVITIDLFSKKRRIVHGRIINKEGKIINVLRDDGKIKKYKITVPEVLGLLEAEQRVEILTTNITNIPSMIKHIE